MLIKKAAAGAEARKPTDLEKRVAAEIVELEKDSALKELKALQFCSVREFDVGGGRKAAALYVPFPQLGDWRKLQKTFVEALEKKLGNATQVLVLAQRTMVSSEGWKRSAALSGVRPKSRSLKSVQSAQLDDLIFPAEIAGKRIRVKTDGSRLLKVQLSKKEEATMDARLPAIANVFKQLCSKDIAFEFA
jgi:small subunit ribosomal protein S7e